VGGTGRRVESDGRVGGSAREEKRGFAGVTIRDRGVQGGEAPRGGCGGGAPDANFMGEIYSDEGEIVGVG